MSGAMIAAIQNCAISTTSFYKMGAGSAKPVLTIFRLTAHRAP
jgi:hypothetical protein